MHAAKKRQSLIHVQQSSMLLVCHVHKTWQLAAILEAGQHLLCIGSVHGNCATLICDWGTGSFPGWVPTGRVA